MSSTVQIIHAPTFNAFKEELDASTHDKEEIFDNSALDVFYLCARKYLFSEGWRLEVDEIEPDYITMGHAIHDFLYTFDLTGSFDKALRSFVRCCKAPNTNVDTSLALDGDQQTSVEWGAYVLQKYVETYPKDKEEFKILLDGDGKPYLEIGFAIDADEGIYCGRIDKVVEAIDDGPIWTKGDVYVVDHKTTKRPLNDAFLKKFNPNNQLTGYLWAVHELTGKWPKGCIVNGIRVHQFKRGTEKSVKEKMFTRVITHRTPTQIRERADQIRWTMKVIKEAKRIYRETGKLFPFWQNAPHACTAYFGCGFTMLCKSQTDDLVKLLAKSNFRKRSWIAYAELEKTKRYEIIKIRAA